MAMAKRQDSEEYLEAMGRARAVRLTVGQQLRELVTEGDRMGSRGEVAERVQLVVQIERRIIQARGQEEQARDLGMPTAPSVHVQREQSELLREAVMGLAAACGTWVAAMDLKRGGQRDD